MTTSNHKHCVFCGESSDSGSTICLSPLNPLPPDTVGNKYHGFPTDYKEKARIAAQKAKEGAGEIEFFSVRDSSI